MLFIAALLCLVAGCATEGTATGRACIPTIATAITRHPEPVTKLETTGHIHEISAWNTVPEQTDSTPCIGADQTNLCERFRRGERLCATRAYPLGATLHIEGWGTCTVVDRTRRKYADRIDLLFGMDVEAAKQFEIQRRYVTLH